MTKQNNTIKYFVVGLKALGVSLLTMIPFALIMFLARNFIENTAVNTALSIILLPLYLVAWGFVASEWIRIY